MNIDGKKNTKSSTKKKNEFNLKKLKIKRRGWPNSPTVSYDGKSLKHQRHLSSARYIYFLNKRIVIKIEESDERWQTQGEIEFFENIREEDKKYFPKFITGDLKRGIIVEKFVRMETPARRPKKVRKLVEKLKKRYTISDLDSEYNHNWAMKKGKKDPIIYDIGGYAMSGSSTMEISS